MAYESPITADDEWFVGEDKRIQLTVYQDGHSPADQDVDPTILLLTEDITGWDLEWTFAKRVRTNIFLTKATTDGSIVILDGPNGLAEVIINRSDTQDMPATVGYHALARTDFDDYAILLNGLAVLRKATV